MERGEAEKSVGILKKIAKVNCRDVDEGVYDDFRSLVNKQYEESKGSAAPGFLPALRKRQTSILRFRLTNVCLCHFFHQT